MARVFRRMLLGLGVSLSLLGRTPPPWEAARLQAVAQARNGHVAAGIAALEGLHQRHPGDPLVTGDLVVLLRLAGRNRDIATLTSNLPSGALPDYALLDWARALRDEHQYARAARGLEGRWQALGLPGRILDAMLLLEAGHPTEAAVRLPSPRAPGLRPVDLADMAYVERRLGHPARALAICQDALASAPADPHALREEVFALSDLGAKGLALEVARAHPGLVDAASQQNLSAEAAASGVRIALQERGRLEDARRFDLRQQPLLQALAHLRAHLGTFPAGSPQALRTRYDEIFTLRSLGRMAEAVAAYEALPQHPRQACPAVLRTIPFYVRHAAADAYAELHHPRQALALYEALLKEDPQAGLDLSVSCYYALLDDEAYGKAHRLLLRLHRTVPAWRATTPPSWNPDRTQVEFLWAMDAAYNRRGTVGLARMRALVARAPGNGGLLDALATLERWQGWPEHARKTTRLAEAYAPGTKDTRINEAEDSRDLEDFRSWGRQIQALARDFPEDSGVQRSLEQWQDRRRCTLASEAETGDSRGQSAGGSPVTGTRDQDWHTRLAGPWSEAGWRPFLDQHLAWSLFPEGGRSYNRLGLGTEWRGGRRHAWALVSQDQLTGRHTGVSGGWSQWLGDPWQIVAQGSTYSLDTPLRAKAADISGRALSASLLWRPDGSRSARLGAGLLALSDGNRRLDLSTGMTQRLQASAHHLTTGGMAISYEHNTRPGGPYFNPLHSASAMLRVEHAWTTWRRFDRSFTQDFRISVGYAWQAGFATRPVSDLFYGHTWALTRTWSLHYGVGWSSNVYDGGREHRLRGTIGFGGTF